MFVFFGGMSRHDSSLFTQRVPSISVRGRTIYRLLDDPKNNGILVFMPLFDSKI